MEEQSRFLHGVVTACSGADIADGSQISEPALLNRPRCLDEQMAYQALSELKPGVKNWNVCVHVSHLWEYRGGTDTGPVQHVDMVLVNNKGNAMYAEIGKDDLEHKAPLLADGNTYTLTRFMVHQLLKFIAKFSEHPNGKVLLWKMGIAQVLNKLLKNCSNASYLEDKAISERGAYRSDQLMLKWRIPLFRCLASIFSAQPSGKEQTAIEE
uniref:Replication protein A 70 kDa DNA-binding subunit B/D first OB fold domain-containing protein n=1 Tax=Aegilops tauschii TaxID=37682 RepID=N1QSJ3_AEGTA